MGWTVALRSWEGTIKELVQVVDRALDEEPWVEGFTPNIRLLRDYTQRGVLDRPERRGKSAVYGYRQVVQLVVARWLLQDGWQLVKVAEVTSARTTEGLLALLPSGAPLNRAQDLVRHFRAAGAARPPKGAPPPVPPVLNSQVRRLARRTSTESALVALGTSGAEVTRERRLVLGLTPWCDVSIDPERLERMTDGEIELLGLALVALLTDDPTRRGSTR